VASASAPARSMRGVTTTLLSEPEPFAIAKSWM
jgi:hypothetical protein